MGSLQCLQAACSSAPLSLLWESFWPRSLFIQFKAAIFCLANYSYGEQILLSVWLEALSFLPLTNQPQ